MGVKKEQLHAQQGYTPHTLLTERSKEERKITSCMILIQKFRCKIRESSSILCRDRYISKNMVTTKVRKAISSGGRKVLSSGGILGAGDIVMISVLQCKSIYMGFFFHFSNTKRRKKLSSN